MLPKARQRNLQLFEDVLKFRSATIALFRQVLGKLNYDSIKLRRYLGYNFSRAGYTYGFGIVACKQIKLCRSMAEQIALGAGFTPKLLGGNIRLLADKSALALPIDSVAAPKSISTIALSGSLVTRLSGVKSR